MRLRTAKFSNRTTRQLLICFILIGVSVWLLLPTITRQKLISVVTQHFSKRISGEQNTKWIITKKDNIDKLKYEELKDWSVIKLKSNETVDKCQGFSNIWNAAIGAINNGAKYIFLTSVVNNKTPGLIKTFKFDQLSSALKYTGSLEDPISSHFQGVNNTRRLDWIKSFSYHLGVWSTSIVQKVINQEETTNPNKVLKIDDRAPSVILQTGRSYPFIKDNVMFLYDAFWSIVPFQDNILWSLWVQRLLLELGSSVSFITMMSSSRRCDPIQGINRPISEKLSKWTCVKQTSFFGCILSLNQFLLGDMIITQKEFDDIDAWLKELMRNGYKEPKLVSKSDNQKSLEPLHRVMFYPKVDPPPQSRNATFSYICPTGIPVCPTPRINKKPLEKFTNLLLVICFNQPNFYNIVDYLEKLYRPFFSQIIVCGLNMEMYTPYLKNLIMPISFVEMNADYELGVQSHKCLQAAMQMNYAVDGYLHLGDDVLLNVWNLPECPKDKIWFKNSLREAYLNETKVASVWVAGKQYWGPWNANRGRIPLNETLNKLKNEQKDNEIAKSFIKQLAENTGGAEKGFYENADIFYIPQKYVQKYVYLVKYFNLYNELAVPTIISGLARNKDIYRLSGTYLWYKERVLYRENYTTSEVYFHPIKIGQCYGDNACKTFLCSRYLSCL